MTPVYEIPFIIALVYLCSLLTYISTEKLLQVCEVWFVLNLHE
jgi:hypothetical protein